MSQRPVVGMGAACGLAAAMQASGDDDEQRKRI